MIVKPACGVSLVAAVAPPVSTAASVTAQACPAAPPSSGSSTSLFRSMVRIALMGYAALVFSDACAALKLELTQGVDALLPVAIYPLQGLGADALTSVPDVVTSDLTFSGRFRVLPRSELKGEPSTASEVNIDYWRKRGIDALLVGRAADVGGGRYRVSVELVNVYQGQDKKLTNPILFAKEFVISQQQQTRLAHHLSDLIYEQLTGVKGIFSTRIAYVLVKTKRERPYLYQLEVSDVDGNNPKLLVSSKEPLMSPAWSPDGKKLAFVSFENHLARIFVVNVATGERQLISASPGINGAPSWSPDGRKLAVVLTKTGFPNVYVVDLSTRNISAVTQSSAIDTEPSWSPDGNSIIFTSGRGGEPQIYQTDFRGSQVRRVTFDGSYNAKGQFTPDGKAIVMLHREGGAFNIAKQDLATGHLEIVTSADYSESPSVAPNGSMVLYTTKWQYRDVLGMSSLDGRVHLRLPAREGDVREPAWSPFIS